MMAYLDFLFPLLNRSICVRKVFIHILDNRCIDAREAAKLCGVEIGILKRTLKKSGYFHLYRLEDEIVYVLDFSKFSDVLGVCKDCKLGKINLCLVEGIKVRYIECEEKNCIHRAFRRILNARRLLVARGFKLSGCSVEEFRKKDREYRNIKHIDEWSTIDFRRYLKEFYGERTHDMWVIANIDTDRYLRATIKSIASRFGEEKKKAITKKYIHDLIEECAIKDKQFYLKELADPRRIRELKGKKFPDKCKAIEIYCSYAGVKGLCTLRGATCTQYLQDKMMEKYN